MTELEIENKKADIQSQNVAQVTASCLAQKNTITIEKEQADKELAAALPALEKAQKAVESIKPADITELKGMRTPAEAARLVMDAVQILFQDSLKPVESRDWTLLKTQTSFVSDSYDDFTSKKFQGPFLKLLLEFSEKEKDNINEETIELLEPYLCLRNAKGEELFHPNVAKIASAALGGLCTWA